MKDKFLSVLRYLEGMFRAVILLMLESAVSKTEGLCIKSWIESERNETTNKSHFHTDSLWTRHSVTWEGSALGASSRTAIWKNLKVRSWES